MVHKQNTREGNIMLKIVILNFQFQINCFVYMLEDKVLEFISKQSQYMLSKSLYNKSLLSYHLSLRFF